MKTKNLGWIISLLTLGFTIYTYKKKQKENEFSPKTKKELKRISGRI